MDLGIIANIITAVATLGLVITGGIALYTWRKEFIGKRKIELAAEIMMTVLEFQGNLMQVRLNRYTPMEIDEIKKWLESVNTKKQNIPNAMLWNIYPEKLFCLTPFHRLNKSAEISDKFFTLMDKSLMYWEESLYKLLYELYSIQGKVRLSSEMLYEDPNNTELQQIAFSNNTTDPISKRMTEIIDEIKLNLEPIYKDRQAKWKKLETKK